MTATTILLNTQHLHVDSKTTVFSFLQALQIYPGRAVVVVNGVAIERADYRKVYVFQGDELELTIDTAD